MELACQVVRGIEDNGKQGGGTRTKLCRVRIISISGIGDKSKILAGGGVGRRGV